MNLKDAKKKVLGDKLKKQIQAADKKELAMGKKVELEHGKVYPHTNVTDNHPVLTTKIAMAHINEIPDYYTRLKKMEQEGEKANK